MSHRDWNVFRADELLLKFSCWESLKEKKENQTLI